LFRISIFDIRIFYHSWIVKKTVEFWAFGTRYFSLAKEYDYRDR
jgi:hypothetical protein